jgi:uncharacterized phage protein (TIGR02218 family)
VKNISNALLAHLQGSTLSVATIWKVTLTNSTVLGFTDHDQDISYSGLVYSASTGYTRSNVQTTETLGVNNLEVQGLLVSPAITEDAMLAGVWDFAKVEVSIINWADTTMGVLQLPTGFIGQITKKRNNFIAELRGLTQLPQQQIGEVYTPSCRADLGDSRCTVNLVPLTVTGSISAVSSNQVLIDAGRTEANGYFDHGLLTFTSGLNNGLQMEVKTYVTGQITLATPMYYAVSVGDTYSMYPGCDKQRPTCVTKFNNIINFRGEPDLPGIDRLTKVVSL